MRADGLSGTAPAKDRRDFREISPAPPYRQSERKTMRRLLRNKYVMLVLGLVILGFGLFQSHGSVTCGSNTMHPGDTCRHVTDGVSTGTYSYDQQKADDKHDNVVAIVAGGALTAGALVWLGVGVAQRRKATEPQQPAQSVITPG